MNNPGFIHEQVAKRIANVRFIITSDSWWKKIFNEDIYAINFKKKKKNVSSEAVKKDDGNKNNDNA